MKYLLLFIPLFLAISHLVAQELDDKADDDEPKTLLSDDVKVTGFGGLFMSFTQIEDNYVNMMGGGGAMIFSEKFFVGGYGLGMTTNLEASKGQFFEKEMDFGHGGLWLGFIFKNRSTIHPTLSAFVGWGNVSARSVTTGYTDRETFDNFFVVSPVLEIEFNLAKFFRIGIGGTYHHYSNINFSEYTDKDFSSPGAYLSLKFGEF